MYLPTTTWRSTFPKFWIGQYAAHPRSSNNLLNGLSLPAVEITLQIVGYIQNSLAQANTTWIHGLPGPPGDFLSVFGNFDLIWICSTRDEIAHRYEIPQELTYEITRSQFAAKVCQHCSQPRLNSVQVY